MIMADDGVHGDLLDRVQHDHRGHLDRVRLVSLILELEPASRRLDDRSGRVEQASRDAQQVEFLGVAADQAWGGMVGEPEPFVLVELRVVQRRQVLQLSDHPRR